MLNSNKNVTNLICKGSSLLSRLMANGNINELKLLQQWRKKRNNFNVCDICIYVWNLMSVRQTKWNTGKDRFLRPQTRFDERKDEFLFWWIFNFAKDLKNINFHIQTFKIYIEKIREKLSPAVNKSISRIVFFVLGNVIHI